MRLRPQNSKQGFTLVEMLVVIAIIAILVSILVPTVMGTVSKAKASTDAGNLRAVMSQINIAMLDGTSLADAAEAASQIESKTFPKAGVTAVYSDGAFFQVFFVSGGIYYGTEYFTEIVNSGTGGRTYQSGDFTNYTVVEIQEPASD